MNKKKSKKRNPQAAQPIVRLSQCMIVKNEERNIERALGWAKNLAFEQIVVDTGSTDRTVEIAEKLGAKVFHFEWINDFGAAKNFAIEQASGNWVAFLDADEYFSDTDAKKMMEYLKEIQSNPAMRAKWFAVNCPWAQVDDSGKPFAMFAQERLFRSFIRYSGKIHEHLDMDTKHLYRVDDITIIHTGYTKTAYEETKKADRNEELLRVELAERPDDVDVKAYLADSLMMKGGVEASDEALKLYREVIDSKAGGHPVLRKKAYSALIEQFVTTSQTEDYTECEELCRRALREFPNDIDIEYFLAVTLNYVNRFQEAWEILRNCETNLVKSALDDSIVVSAKPLLLFVQTAIAAQGINNIEGLVRYTTMVLKEDNTMDDVLRSLIATLLTHGTSDDELLSLLSKLYNFSNPKDLLFIGRAAKECGAIGFARKIIEMTGQRLATS